MKFVIISPYEEIHNCGVRGISSILKGKGVDVRIVFCPVRSRVGAYFFQRGMATALPDEIIADIAEIAKDATCIGISLMTDYFHPVATLTKELKKRLPDVPVIWGEYMPRYSRAKAPTTPTMSVSEKATNPCTSCFNPLRTGKRIRKFRGFIIRGKAN